MNDVPQWWFLYSLTLPLSLLLIAMLSARCDTPWIDSNSEPKG